MVTRFAKKHYPAFTILFTTLLFFYPVIFAKKTFFFRDLHRIFYPMKAFLASAYQDGTFPFWCPQLFCGAPFAGFIPNGAFHPFAFLFLLFDLPHSLNLFILSHFLLGFCFFYLFITGLGASRKAAVFTGVSYCYGSYTIAALNLLSHLQTTIWIPAILWSFHQAVTRENPRHLILTVGFLSMALLGGAPQLLLITAGMLFMGALVWVPPDRPGLRARIGNLGRLPLLLVLAVAVTAVQLGPMYIDYLNSIRLDGITFAEATRHSLEPGMLRHLLIPLSFPADFINRPAIFTNFFPGGNEIPWLLTVYPGFLILPLALLGTCRDFSMDRGIWLFMFLLGVGLALGHYTPLYHLFYAVFPSFRFPEKFMVMAGFSLLVLAAFGFDYLVALCRSRSMLAGRLFIFLTGVLIIDLFLAHRYLNPVCDAAFYHYHHPDLEVVVKDAGQHRIFIDPDISKPAGNFNTIQNTHIQWQRYLFPNTGILKNLSYVGGATGLELNHQYLITEILLKPWLEKIDFLRLANVKYIVSANRLEKIPGLEKQLQRINANVYRIKNSLPRAWVVGQLLPAPAGVLAGLADLSFDMRTAALVRENIAADYQTPYFLPVRTLDYRSGNQVIIETLLERPGILVLTESAYPGWRVTVDGVARDILNLNFLFQGVALDKGYHRIEFTFRPQYFNAFLSVSLAAGCLCLFGWLAWEVIGRKKKHFPGC